MGLISEKTEALYAEPNERAEAATSIYFAQTIFENIFVLCLWLRIIRRSDERCLVHEFSFIDIV